jgi:hypothetical protein
VAALVSEDIQASTLKRFLENFKAEVQTRAQAICGLTSYFTGHWENFPYNIWTDDDAEIEDRTPEEKDEIVRQAERIVKSGWSPSHMMIDKSAAERNAIKAGNVCHSHHQSQI